MNPKVLCEKVKKSAMIVGVHEEGGPLIRRFTTHNFRHSGTTLLADTDIKDSFIVYYRGDSPDRSMDRYHHPTTEKLIMEYLKYMPEFNIGESPADSIYMKAIEESMKRDEENKRMTKEIKNTGRVIDHLLTEEKLNEIMTEVRVDSEKSKADDYIHLTTEDLKKEYMP